ncbi:hypothetical protein HHK36_012792 [Tetracentron sinense]|uniref:AT-hook motif nuclear-localized protein n=1 Tax=Tetracentron sinense TaxID=13715 RepID=A0A834Z9X6_TETSI|nr:hypothetical protein HHK36_012792 [Tetracentron sinense]
MDTFVTGVEGLETFLEYRGNRAALFDGIEEGGIRASSSYSHEIDEHDNDSAIDGLQDRVNLLKRLSGDIHEEVETHNSVLDQMGNNMDSSRGILSGTMDRFKMVSKPNSVNSFAISFLLFTAAIPFADCNKVVTTVELLDSGESVDEANGTALAGSLLGFGVGIVEPIACVRSPVFLPLFFQFAKLANRWWTEPLGPPGIGPAAGSLVMKKRDRETSINDNGGSSSGGRDDEEERENGDETKDGAVEVVNRRPRGRPSGSKNKPKPPIFVTRDSPNALRSHVMEVAAGADIVESVAQFARRRQRGVCVLSGSGAVANVTLRQPASSGAVVALHGRFEILSLTGAFLPGPAPPGSTGLTVYVAGGPGQVLGGIVVGTLVAAGPVMVIAAIFANATFERLPLEEEDDDAGGGQLPGGAGSSPPAIGQQQQAALPPDPSSSLPVYNVPPNLFHTGGGMNNDAYAWAHSRSPY